MNKVWLNRKGEYIPISEMSDSYLQNALNYCLESDDTYGRFSIEIDELKEEINLRKFIKLTEEISKLKEELKLIKEQLK